MGASRGRRLRVSSLYVLIAAVLGAAVLGGCGSAGVGASTGNRAALLGTLENWSAVQTTVDQARGILTQRCMARHGFRYYPFSEAGQPGGSPLFTSQLFGSSLWLGPQSLAWASVNGWGLYEETMERLSQRGGFFGGQSQESQVMRSLRGRQVMQYFRTLQGTGKSVKIRIPGLPHTTIQIGGCTTTAGEKLFGSIAAAVAAPDYGESILSGTVESSAGRSPALRASEARWAACVRARTGITTKSPSQLFLHFYTLYNTKGPTPRVHREELSAAVADLTCERGARLSQSTRAAELAAVGRLPKSVLGEIQTLLADLDQARTRAQTVFAHASAATRAAAESSSTTGSGAVEEFGGGLGGSVVYFGG